MENYKGEGTYEPSADELIDVLKNLENLAAINPALYRAIVDQIKGKYLKYSNHAIDIQYQKQKILIERQEQHFQKNAVVKFWFQIPSTFFVPLTCDSILKSSLEPTKLPQMYMSKVSQLVSLFQTAL